MKKTYNLTFESDKFVIRYSRPDNKEEALEIDIEKMELDSEKMYRTLFENVSEHIEICIVNMIDATIDDKIQKKGKRVADTIQRLCNEICEEINKKCFDQ